MDTARWQSIAERNDALLANGAFASWQQIKDYVEQLHSEISQLRAQVGTNGTEQSNKKRKLDEPSGSFATMAHQQQLAVNGGWTSQQSDLTMPDVSFSVPMRKKMEVGLVGGPDGGLKVVDQKAGSVEASMSWLQIEQIVCVSVPEKAAPAHNFLFIPRDVNQETIVFTLPDTPATSFKPSNTPSARAPNIDLSSTIQYEALIRWIATSSAGRCHVTEPSAEEFLSALIQPHKSSVKPAHAKAFRGSKDGFLFLLTPGMVFGFRKPVLWFPFDRIVSVSYTSVLQRTFNMVIAARGVESGKDAEEEIEYEFAMLDQADFAGIDAYIKRHGLQDASLADARRAKRYGVNDPKRRQAEDVGGDDTLDEPAIVKTEAQLQDEEDEQEEDFDPGSQGNSDGSGSDSEEEEGGYNEVEEFEYGEQGDGAD